VSEVFNWAGFVAAVLAIVGGLAGGFRWLRERTRPNAIVPHLVRVDDEVRVANGLAARQSSTPRLGSLRIGSQLHIDGIEAVAQCDREFPYTNRHRFVFRGPSGVANRPAPPEWPTLEREVLPQILSERRKRGMLVDEPSPPIADLVDVRVDSEGAGQTITYLCSVGESEFRRFLATSNQLDAPLGRVGKKLGAKALRELWSSRNSEPAGFRNVSHLTPPAPVYIATVTVVISQPTSSMILLPRTRYHALAAIEDDRLLGRLVHFVGEGGLASDADEHCVYSPTATARRGVKDELHVRDRFPLLPTGVYWDRIRWQPVFCFVAFVDYTLEELQALAPGGAREASEVTEGLHATPWDLADHGTRALLLDRHGSFFLASNHARVAMLAALYWRHGPTEVAHLLKD
jgi:hypothetical protein